MSIMAHHVKLSQWGRKVYITSNPVAQQVWITDNGVAEPVCLTTNPAADHIYVTNPEYFAKDLEPEEEDDELARKAASSFTEVADPDERRDVIFRQGYFAGKDKRKVNPVGGRVMVGPLGRRDCVTIREDELYIYQEGYEKGKADR